MIIFINLSSSSSVFNFNKHTNMRLNYQMRSIHSTMAWAKPQAGQRPGARPGIKKRTPALSGSAAAGQIRSSDGVCGGATAGRRRSNSGEVAWASAPAASLPPPPQRFRCPRPKRRFQTLPWGPRPLEETTSYRGFACTTFDLPNQRHAAMMGGSQRPPSHLRWRRFQ